MNKTNRKISSKIIINKIILPILVIVIAFYFAFFYNEEFFEYFKKDFLVGIPVFSLIFGLIFYNIISLFLNTYKNLKLFRKGIVAEVNVVDIKIKSGYEWIYIFRIKFSNENNENKIRNKKISVGRKAIASFFPDWLKNQIHKSISNKENFNLDNKKRAEIREEKINIFLKENNIKEKIFYNNKNSYFAFFFEIGKDLKINEINID